MQYYIISEDTLRGTLALLNELPLRLRYNVDPIMGALQSARKVTVPEDEPEK